MGWKHSRGADGFERPPRAATAAATTAKHDICERILERWRLAGGLTQMPRPSYPTSHPNTGGSLLRWMRLAGFGGDRQHPRGGAATVESSPAGAEAHAKRDDQEDEHTTDDEGDGVTGGHHCALWGRWRQRCQGVGVVGTAGGGALRAKHIVPRCAPARHICRRGAVRVRGRRPVACGRRAAPAAHAERAEPHRLTPLEGSAALIGAAGLTALVGAQSVDVAREAAAEPRQLSPPTRPGRRGCGRRWCRRFLRRRWR